MQTILRKYGAQATINFSLMQVDGLNFRVDAAHATGDTALMKDEGAEANTSNAFVDEGNGYSIILTATEMEAARIVIYLVDQSGTKVWIDKAVTIETYGDASAQHAFDLNSSGVDVISISGDTVAADNLEATFDGTGYSNDAAPSTQSQVGNLATGSAAISVQAESYILTTGTLVSGSVTDTETVNAVEQQHSDASGTMDLYYQFDVSGSGIGVEVNITGRVQGGNDDLTIYAYDWAGTKWDAIGPLEGKNSSNNTNQTYSMLIRHTGSGSNLGKVRIRFSGTGLTSANLYVDQIFTSYSSVTKSVGYEGGKVWVNTVTGILGTESFVNGTADNPSKTLADATTIAGNVGLSKFDLSPKSSITLTQGYPSSMADAYGASIDMNGQDISDTHTHGGHITGVIIGTGSIHFIDSEIGTVTLVPVRLNRCALVGTITVSVTGVYTFYGCHAQTTTGDSPIFDFSTVSGVTLNNRNYSGAFEIQNMSADDVMNLDGQGKLTISANCTGGILAIRGLWEVVDNSGGVLTITYDDMTTNVATRTPTASQLAYMTAHAATAKPVTFLAGGTTTTAILNTVDGSPASSINDIYNGRLLVFNAGSLNSQVVDITNYDGATKVATVSAAITSIDASHTAVLV